jgi:hypothetical protein
VRTLVGAANLAPEEQGRSHYFALVVNQDNLRGKATCRDHTIEGHTKDLVPGSKINVWPM